MVFHPRNLKIVPEALRASPPSSKINASRILAKMRDKVGKDVACCRAHTCCAQVLASKVPSPWRRCLAQCSLSALGPRPAIRQAGRGRGLCTRQPRAPVPRLRSPWLGRSWARAVGGGRSSVDSPNSLSRASLTVHSSRCPEAAAGALPSQSPEMHPQRLLLRGLERQARPSPPLAPRRPMASRHLVRPAQPQAPLGGSAPGGV